MLKLLTTVLKKKFWGAPPAADASVQDDSTPVFESLVMTDDLRDALFPKTPQMVSAIFDRPPPLDRNRGASAPPSQAYGHAAQGSAGRGTAFPVIF